ncbi:MAG: hypothetical protein ACYS7Y_28725 [Planctomycetota bacterium]|jgi:hypothetical protein
MIVAEAVGIGCLVVLVVALIVHSSIYADKFTCLEEQVDSLEDKLRVRTRVIVAVERKSPYGWWKIDSMPVDEVLQLLLTHLDLRLEPEKVGKTPAKLVKAKRAKK